MRVFLIMMFVYLLPLMILIVVSAVAAYKREAQMRRIEQLVTGTRPTALPPKGYDWSYDATLETWELKKNE